MITIPVEKLQIGDRLAFRFPPSTARVLLSVAARIPAELLAPGLLTEGQLLLMDTPAWHKAIYRTEEWVYHTRHITLTPNMIGPKTRDFLALEVFDDLYEWGKFEVGEYTYVVS